MNKSYTTVSLPKALVDDLRTRYPNMSIATILSRKLAELQAEGSNPSGPTISKTMVSQNPFSNSYGIL